MKSEWEDRVAIVVGASSGIGLATARALLEGGAHVAMFARREAELAKASAGSDRAMHHVGDAGDESAIDALFARTEREFGPCELLINVAGMVDPAPMHEITRQRWDRMFEVTVTSGFLASRRALPGMLASGRGAIVNVASISGVIGSQKFGGFVSYAAAKAAVIGMTEALAAEVRDYGIRVNSVSPGSVDTAMLKAANESLIPDMSPEEVAQTILFLLSDRSRPMNGQNLHVYSA